MKFRTRNWATLVLTGGVATVANALEVTVSIENVAPENGAYLTPVWVGFHNGRFDLLEPGMPASEALERLAEDGDTAPLSAAFQASKHGTVDATIVSDSGIPPLAPGETGTMTFQLKGDFRQHRFFSYAAMVIPSNDAFIANDDDRAIRLFNSRGEFIGCSFTVRGSAVHDAGTELNDEDPMHTAFFGQAAPDMGQDESVPVHDHVGLKLPGSGGIVDDPEFANANVIGTGEPLARIKITATTGLGELGDAALRSGGLDAWDDAVPRVGDLAEIDGGTPYIGQLAPSRH
jgi:hypothetical protein